MNRFTIYPLGLIVAGSLSFLATPSVAQVAITGGTISVSGTGTVFAPNQPNGTPILQVNSIQVNGFNLTTPQGGFSSPANQFTTNSFNGTSNITGSTSAVLSGQLQGSFSGVAYGSNGSPIMFSNIPSNMTGTIYVQGTPNINGSIAFTTGGGTGQITSGTINTSGNPIQPGLSDSQLSFTNPVNPPPLPNPPPLTPPNLSPSVNPSTIPNPKLVPSFFPNPLNSPYPTGVEVSGQVQNDGLTVRVGVGVDPSGKPSAQVGINWQIGGTEKGVSRGSIEGRFGKSVLNYDPEKGFGGQLVYGKSVLNYDPEKGFGGQL